jgi:hypothetical protein
MFNFCKDLHRGCCTKGNTNAGRNAGGTPAQKARGNYALFVGALGTLSPALWVNLKAKVTAHKQQSYAHEHYSAGSCNVTAVGINEERTCFTPYFAGLTVAGYGEDASGTTLRCDFVARCDDKSASQRGKCAALGTCRSAADKTAALTKSAQGDIASYVVGEAAQCYYDHSSLAAGCSAVKPADPGGLAAMSAWPLILAVVASVFFIVALVKYIQLAGQLEQESSSAGRKLPASKQAASASAGQQAAAVTAGRGAHAEQSAPAPEQTVTNALVFNDNDSAPTNTGGCGELWVQPHVCP